MDHGRTMETETALENGKESGEEEELPPVEGREAWLNVLGSFLAHFVVFGSVYVFSLFIKDYEDMFGETRGTISVIFQLQLGLLFAFGFFTGKLTDRLGVTRIFSFGIVMLTLGFFLASFAEEFWQAVLTHGLLVGIGCGCCYWPAVTVVPMWFDKRRGLALGLAVLGSGLGNFVLGIVLERLLTTQGFRASLRIHAAWSLGLLLIAVLVLKRRLPRVKRGICESDRDILLDRKFMIIFVAAMFFQTGYNIPFGNLGAYVEDQGLDSKFAGFAVGMIGIGSAVGRILMGFLADYFGRVRGFKASIIGTGIFCSVWIACTTKASILFFAFFFGFFSGGMISLVPVVMGEFFGVQRLATVMGYVAISLIPGSFLGPYLAGVLYDNSGSYRNTIIFAAVSCAVAAVLLLPIPDEPSYSARKAKDVTFASQTSNPNFARGAPSERVAQV